MDLTAAVQGTALTLFSFLLKQAPAVLCHSFGFFFLPVLLVTPHPSTLAKPVHEWDFFCESVIRGQPTMPGRVAGWTLNTSPRQI